MVYLILCFILYFLLFVISRKNIKLFFKIFQNKKIAVWIISFLFFPGTIIHELSHFIIATSLFLRVRDIEIFPHLERENLKLGRVIYERKDFLRSFFVGISPLFFGTLVLYLIFYFKFFPSQNLIYNLFFGYLIFSISSTMFSSPQDLKDAKYLIPLGFILMFLIYLFDIQINFYFNFINKYTAVFFEIFKILFSVFLIQFLVWIALSLVYKSKTKNVYFTKS